MLVIHWHSHAERVNNLMSPKLADSIAVVCFHETSTFTMSSSTFKHAPSSNFRVVPSVLPKLRTWQTLWCNTRLENAQYIELLVYYKLEHDKNDQENSNTPLRRPSNNIQQSLNFGLQSGKLPGQCFDRWSLKLLNGKLRKRTGGPASSAPGKYRYITTIADREKRHSFSSKWCLLTEYTPLWDFPQHWQSLPR